MYASIVFVNKFVSLHSIWLSETDPSTRTPVDDMKSGNNFTGSGSGMEKDDLTNVRFCILNVQLLSKYNCGGD